MRLRLEAALALIPIVLAVVACSDNSSQSTEPASTSADPSAIPRIIITEGLGMSYEEPVPLTSPATDTSPPPTTWQPELLGLSAEDEVTVPSVGITVNGIELAPGHASTNCDRQARPEVADFLEFGYLPPGTFAGSPQYSAVCPDGSTAWTLQEFLGASGSFQIIHFPDEHRVAAGQGSAAYPIAVADDPGVLFVQRIAGVPTPATVAFLTDRGLIEVVGHGPHPSEVLRIAENITCSGC